MSHGRDHGARRQALFAPKLLACLDVTVDVVGIFFRTFSVPAKAAEIVLFLLLPLGDLGSKRVIGVGAELAEIDADFGYATRRFESQLFKYVEGRNDLLESP